MYRIHAQVTNEFCFVNFYLEIVVLCHGPDNQQVRTKAHNDHESLDTLVYRAKLYPSATEHRTHRFAFADVYRSYLWLYDRLFCCRRNLDFVVTLLTIKFNNLAIQ